MSIVWDLIRMVVSAHQSFQDLSCLQKSKKRQPQYPMEEAYLVVVTCGRLNRKDFKALFTLKKVNNGKGLFYSYRSSH